MPFYRRVVLYFDGASRSNPHGPAGYGWVLWEMDENGAEIELIEEDNGYLGMDCSNNKAEYRGLCEGLSWIYHNIECDVVFVRGDSEIVIKQMDNIYAVRSDNLRPHFDEANLLLQRIGCDYRFKWISRGQNARADELANAAIDDNY